MITACLKRMYDVAISLSSLRNIHTYRNTHTLTTPLSILTSLLLVHIPAFSSFSKPDPKGASDFVCLLETYPQAHSWTSPGLPPQTIEHATEGVKTDPSRTPFPQACCLLGNREPTQ